MLCLIYINKAITANLKHFVGITHIYISFYLKGNDKCIFISWSVGDTVKCIHNRTHFFSHTIFPRHSYLRCHTIMKWVVVTLRHSYIILSREKIILRICYSDIKAIRLIVRVCEKRGRFKIITSLE